MCQMADGQPGGLHVASGWLTSILLVLFVLASGWFTQIRLSLFVLASGWFGQFHLVSFSFISFTFSASGWLPTSFGRTIRTKPKENVYIKTTEREEFLCSC